MATSHLLNYLAALAPSAQDVSAMDVVQRRTDFVQMGWHDVFGIDSTSRSGVPRLPDVQRLATLDELAVNVPSGTAIASPDWDRVGAELSASFPDSIRIIRESRSPAAADIARLCLHREREGRPSEPLVPIYLHPAVART